MKKKYVYRKTIWNKVGGGLSSPNEKKLVTIHGKKILIERAPRLNYYGNPVHTVSIINNNGQVIKSTKGAGSTTLLVSELLKKVGITTKY